MVLNPVAKLLLQAHQTHSRQSASSVPPEQQPSTRAAALDIQRAVWNAREPTPWTSARFWKSGGPRDESMLTWAALPESGVLQSPADLREDSSPDHWIEAEIAVRLGRDVDVELASRLDAAAANALVDACCVSIERVASRWQEGLAAPDLMRLADMQSHLGLVLGEWQTWTSRDWSQQRCEVQVGDAPTQVFIGTLSCIDPLWVLPAWLRDLTSHGVVVPAGTVVTTGSWVGVLPVAPRQSVRVSFAGIGEAQIQF